MVFDFFAPVAESVAFLIQDRFPRAASTGPVWRRILAIIAMLLASLAIAILVLLTGVAIVALVRELMARG